MLLSMHKLCSLLTGRLCEQHVTVRLEQGMSTGYVLVTS